jgi:hypothetical protein
MRDRRITGTGLRGDSPRRLDLSDGTRLMLDATIDQDRVEWRRLGRRRTRVSVSEARRLAGDEFASYVTVRTRAEAEWLLEVSDWYREQADRLQRELADTTELADITELADTTA